MASPNDTCDCFGEKENPLRDCEDCGVKASCNREWNKKRHAEKVALLAKYKQCSGLCAQGIRCNRKTKNESGRCHIHQTQTDADIAQIRQDIISKPEQIRCKGIRMNGQRCSRKTTDKSGLCSEHRQQEEYPELYENLQLYS